MKTSPESTVALAALTAVTIRQQMLSLASSTLKLAASALRFQQQQQQQQLPQAQITTTFSSSLLPEYSLDQVSWHSSQDDCWIVIYDKVYNITEFLHKHPGGLDVLLEYAGRDATLAFRGVGHSAESVADMERYLIGILPASERMYLRKF